MEKKTLFDKIWDSHVVVSEPECPLPLYRPPPEGARFGAGISIDAGKIEPMITHGTNPGMGLPVTARVPDPAMASDASKKNALTKALDYMRLKSDQPLFGQKIDAVFIGSCTNSHLSDLRSAARILRGRKVNAALRVYVVSGSQEIKAAAESEGLRRILQEAGAEWREPGGSMCVPMNGGERSPGQY